MRTLKIKGYLGGNALGEMHSKIQFELRHLWLDAYSSKNEKGEEVTILKKDGQQVVEFDGFHVKIVEQEDQVIEALAPLIDPDREEAPYIPGQVFLTGT